jgi:hypothetical protein
MEGKGKPSPSPVNIASRLLGFSLFLSECLLFTLYLSLLLLSDHSGGLRAGEFLEAR